MRTFPVYSHATFPLPFRFPLSFSIGREEGTSVGVEGICKEGFLCVAHLDCALKTSFGKCFQCFLQCSHFGGCCLFACLPSPFLLLLKSTEPGCIPSIPVIVTSCHTLVPGSFINVSSNQPYGPRLTRGHGGVCIKCVTRHKPRRRKRC